MTAEIKALIPRGPRPSNEDVSELTSMLLAMARPLIDTPESIVVFPAVGHEFVAFEVHCEDRDGGALIGKRGVYADAMRTLLQAVAARMGLRVQVQFMSREQETLSPR